MITQNVTLGNAYEGKIIQKVEQNFNPGLELIGLSGTGPRLLLCVHAWDLFGLPQRMNGIHTTESDHECFDLLSCETYAKHNVGGRVVASICLHS